MSSQVNINWNICFRNINRLSPNTQNGETLSNNLLAVADE